MNEDGKQIDQCLGLLLLVGDAMQTFLPYRDFQKSASVIDNKRLWKQVLEADGIIQIIVGRRKGYKNHPAVKMWEGYCDALICYRNECVREWLKRRLHYGERQFEFDTPYNTRLSKDPPWFGDERLHSSHRAALLKKNIEWYSRFGWKEEPVINYYWPVR